MGLCKKPVGGPLAAGAANNYFERTSFFLILRSKMRKNDVRSKLSFTAEGGERLIAQPQAKGFLHKFISYETHPLKGSFVVLY